MNVCRVTNLKPHERRATTRDDQDPEHLRQAVARARSVVARKCRAIGSRRLLTLTTREPVTDLDEFWILWKRFLQRCERAGIHFRYVAVPELQKRGAWHLHVAIDRFIPQRALLTQWLALVGSGSINLTAFNTQASSAETCIAISSYISKYLGKDMGSSDLGRKRYRTSVGIPVLKDTIQIPAQFSGTMINLYELFKQESQLTPGSYRVNDYGGKWIASWGSTLDER